MKIKTQRESCRKVRGVRRERSTARRPLKCSVTRNFSNASLGDQLKDPRDDRIVKPGRDQAVSETVFAARHRPYVVTRPREFVDLVEDNPGPLVVQAQCLFDARWQLDRSPFFVGTVCVIGATVTRGAPPLVS